MTDQISGGALDATLGDGPARATPAPGMIATAAGLLIGAAALLSLGLQPVLLGGLAEAGRLTVQAMGRVATGEIFALAFASTIGPRLLVTGGGIRQKAMVAAAIVVLLDGLSCVAKSGDQIVLLRTLAGLFEGLMLSAALLVVTYTPHPERMNAVFQVVQTIPQVVFNYLLATWLNPRFGSNAGFTVMAALALISVAAAARLNRNPPATARGARVGARLFGPFVLVVLCAIVLENLAIGAVWSYLGRLASLRHFSHQAAGLAVSGVLAFQLTAAVVVAWQGWRLRHRPTLIFTCAFVAFDFLFIGATKSESLFVTAACAFGFVQLMLYPFSVKLLVALDPSRRAAMLLSPLSLVGTSLGPLACSLVVRSNDISMVFWIAFAAMGSSGLLIALTYLAKAAPDVISNGQTP